MVTRALCRSAVLALAVLLIVPGQQVSAQFTVQNPAETVFSAELPGESKFVDVMGVQMHYIEMGKGDPILFLHGNPTSSYLWRNVVPYVESAGRVLALDLVGFGKSGKPDIDYIFQDHAAYLKAFIETLDLRNLVIVGHDWGSALGLDYAAHNEERIKGVVFMEAIIPPTFPRESFAQMGATGEIFKRFRTPDEGRRLLIDENYFIERNVANAAITRKLSEAEMDVYREPFLDPASRLPIYMWPKELPIGGDPQRNVEMVENIGEWLTVSDVPKLVLYARPGALLPPRVAAWMAENYKNVETIFVGYGRHYIQEDSPEAIGRNIADWYRRKF